MVIKSLAQTLKDLATGIKNTITGVTGSNATLTITKGNGTTSTVTINNVANAINATKATQDSAGQQINSTYIKGLSVSGKTITYTKGNGSTGTITTQDIAYTHPTTSGNKHIPSGGSSGQILRWSDDGTAVWGADNNTTYSTATQNANGLMSASDKKKLDGIATSANNYSHPNSGVTAGTYRSVTVNAQGHVTGGSNPTTLSGYGITDAPTKTGSGASGTWGINISGNSATSTNLETARNFKVNLASTEAASFNGTADTTPGVTGILPIANGGTGATTAAAACSNLGITCANIGAASTSHTHDDRYYTENEIDSKLTAKADKTHNHDDIYLNLSGGTLKGNIELDQGSIYNIGSEDKKLKALYADEVHISQNTLYINETPVLGTDSDTIIVKADTDQSVLMKTSGIGVSQITSEKAIDVTVKGDNGNISVTTNGNNSSINLSATKNINITGESISIDGNATIKNLNVTGTTTTVNSNDLSVKDNIIEINSGETGNGVSKGTAGIKVNRGDELPYLIEFDETEDMFKVGMQGDLETIASQNYVNGIVNNKADKTHTHDDRYYTESEINSKLSGKSDTTHTHNYLPLAGGTTTGKVTMKSANLDNLPQVFRTDGTNFAGIKFQNTNGYLGAIGITGNTNSVLQRLDANGNLYPILDSSNYNNYLPTNNTMDHNEIGDIKWSSADLTHAGFLIANGAEVGRATYPDLCAVYEAMGFPWGAGDGSTTFNLPNLIGKFAEGADSAGGYHEAGLPNIEGGFRLRYMRTSTGPDSIVMFPSGVISTEELDTDNLDTPYSGSYSASKITKVALNASRSNSIYGASTTVQPPSALLIPYVKAFAGASADSTDLAITEVANDVARLSANLVGKNECKSYVVESVVNKDGSWYRKYSDGWLEQGGYMTTPQKGNTTVNLLKPMADDTYSVIAVGDGYSTTAFDAVEIGTRTTTSFDYYSASNHAESNVKAIWRVCGMGAE